MSRLASASSFTSKFDTVWILFRYCKVQRADRFVMYERLTIIEFPSIKKNNGDLRIIQLKSMRVMDFVTFNRLLESVNTRQAF